MALVSCDRLGNQSAGTGRVEFVPTVGAGYQIGEVMLDVMAA